MAETTRDAVYALIARESGFPVASLDDHKALGADLGMDSLDVLELVFEIEGKLAIEIDDELLVHWQTVGDVVQAVEANTPLQRAPSTGGNP